MKERQTYTQCDTEKLNELLLGSLSPEETAVVESHLSECASCAEQIQMAAVTGTSWNEAQSMLALDEFDGLPSLSSTKSLFPAEVGDREYTPTADLLAREIRGWLDPTDDPQMLGRFAGYEIVGIIGHGGMGIVLKGFEASLNRYVAIKVLAPRLAANGAARQRFAREAQAAAAVLHDNVVAIHRVDEFHGLPFLVMPYIADTSLQKRINDEGPLPIAAVLRIGSQIAAGLAAAHLQGLVHRDIKPANIMLEKNVERVTITDFGLARTVDDASLTKTGIIAGTPQYMSPEQARGETVDQRSDLFSLGSVLYVMCTGRTPFRADTSYGVLRRITDEGPRPIREINPDIPEWLCRIIAKLMSKRPDDRFESAREVAKLLEECLAHVQQPDVVPLPASHSGFREEPPRPRIRLWIVALGAVAMFIVAAAVILVRLGETTVRLEIDDPSLAVRFGDDVITVDNDGREIHIKPGEKNAFVITQDNQVIESRSFKLNKGQKVVLHVSTAVDGHIDLKSDDPDFSFERPSVIQPRGRPDVFANGKHTPQVLYTISQGDDSTGDLIRIDVNDRSVKTTILRGGITDKLGLVKGLASSDCGLLYAVVNFKDDDTRMHTINIEDLDNVVVFPGGAITERNVDGLVCHKGELFGVTSNEDGRLLKPDGVGPHRLGRSLGLHDVDAIVFDSKGRLITASGAGDRAFFEIENEAHVGIQDKSPIKRLAPIPTPDGRDIEGLALGTDGFLYAVTGPSESNGMSELWRIDSATLRGERLASLKYAAYCLTADERLIVNPQAVKERTHLRHAHADHVANAVRRRKPDAASRPETEHSKQVTPTDDESNDRQSLAYAVKRFNESTAEVRSELFDPPIEDLTVERLREGLRQSAQLCRDRGKRQVADALLKIAESGRLPDEAVGGLIGSGTHAQDDDGKTISRQVVPALVLPDNSTPSGRLLVVLRPLELFYRKDGPVSKDYGDLFDLETGRLIEGTELVADFQSILGHWEVVSVKGTGGQFMSLSDQSKPGDRMVIAHVDTPNGRLWLSEALRDAWSRDDSLHLHPKADPSRLTYKARDGKKNHFTDTDNPPDYGIYRIEGNELTILAGDPRDFSVNQGTESVPMESGTDNSATSPGRSAVWSWKFVIPNYAQGFELEEGRRQISAKLRRVGSGAEAMSDPTTVDPTPADRGKKTLELLELVTGKGDPWVATTYCLEMSDQRLFKKRGLTAGVTVVDLNDVSDYPDVTFKVRLFLPHVSRRGADYVARNGVHLWVSKEELGGVADGKRLVRAFYVPKDSPEGSQLLKATTLDAKAAQSKWLAETEKLGDLIAVVEIARSTKPAVAKLEVSGVERLQGVWLLESEEQFGHIQADSDPEREPLRVVIERQALRGCFDAPWKPITWSLEFDNETRPQAMYLTARANGNEKTRSVRFRLCDDKLELCFDRRNPKRLPVQLGTAQGSNAIIWHMRRADAAKASNSDAEPQP